MALVPDVPENCKLQDYPFSDSFLVQCFLRCLERQGHLTMPNDDPRRLLRLIILFCQQFKGVAFDEHFRQEYGFDNIVRVRFTMEHEDLEMPKRITSLLRSLMAHSEIAQDDKNLQEVCRIIGLYRNFFGAAGCPSTQEDNTRLMVQTLNEISATFKSRQEVQKVKFQDSNQLLGDESAASERKSLDVAKGKKEKKTVEQVVSAAAPQTMDSVEPETQSSVSKAKKL